MFNIFRKSPNTEKGPVPAAAPPAEQPDDPPSNAFDQMEAIARCIDRFMVHATFIGALDAAPGYRAQMTPNGIQVAANRDKRIGVVLDQNLLGISVGGVPAASLALIAASTYFKHHQKHEPNWHVRNAPDAPQILDVEIPFGVRNILQMTCKEQPVCTQFDGKNEPGCTLMITVRPKS